MNERNGVCDTGDKCVTDSPQYKSCRVCGRTLSVSDWMTSCPHCRAPSPWNVDNGIVMLKPEITREQAIRAVRDWWQTGICSSESGIRWKRITRAIQDLRNNRLMSGNLEHMGNFRECQLTYVPFWKFEAYAAGRVKGYISEPGYESETWTRADVSVYVHRAYTSIACDPEDISFEHLPLHTGVTVPPDRWEGMALKTTVPGKDVLAGGIEEIRKIAIKNSGVDHIRSIMIDVKPADLSLWFFPVWVVKYTFSERTYTATIDSMSGRILSGLAPGNTLLRGIAFVTGTAFSILAAAGCIAIVQVCNLLIASSDAGNTARMGAVLVLFIFPITLVAPVCWFITYPAFAFFTHGRDIAAGESKHGYNPAARKKDTLFVATFVGVFIGYMTSFLGWTLFYFHSVWHASVLILGLILAYMYACKVIYQPLRVADDDVAGKN